MTNQLEFTVLLNKEQRNNRGFSIDYEIRGAHFFRGCFYGLVKSIAAIQEAGLLQVPAYFLANGRIHADQGKDYPSEFVWTEERYHGLGEQLTLQAKGYNNVPDDLVVLDIQGAGLFMPRPEEIKEAVSGSHPDPKIRKSSSKELKDYGYPVSGEEKDLLLGEKHAYRWNGSKIEIVPFTFFPSYDAFREEAKTSEFKRKLKDMTAVYGVIRSVEEVQKLASIRPGPYFPTKDLLAIPDVMIHLGGEDQVREMILDKDGTPRFEWENYSCGARDRYTIDSGYVVELSRRNGIRYKGLIGEGSLVGVAPEALAAQNASNGKNMITSPTLEQVLALGKEHVSKAKMSAFETQARKLY